MKQIFTVIFIFALGAFGSALFAQEKEASSDSEEAMSVSADQLIWDSLNLFVKSVTRIIDDKGVDRLSELLIASGDRREDLKKFGEMAKTYPGEKIPLDVPVKHRGAQDMDARLESLGLSFLQVDPIKTEDLRPNERPRYKLWLAARDLLIPIVIMGTVAYAGFQFISSGQVTSAQNSLMSSQVGVWRSAIPFIGTAVFAAVARSVSEKLFRNFKPKNPRSLTLTLLTRDPVFIFFAGLALLSLSHLPFTQVDFAALALHPSLGFSNAPGWMTALALSSAMLSRSFSEYAFDRMEADGSLSRLKGLTLRAISLGYFDICLMLVLLSQSWRLGSAGLLAYTAAVTLPLWFRTLAGSRALDSYAGAVVEGRTNKISSIQLICAQVMRGINKIAPFRRR